MSWYLILYVGARRAANPQQALEILACPETRNERARLQQGNLTSRASFLNIQKVRLQSPSTTRTLTQDLRKPPPIMETARKTWGKYKSILTPFLPRPSSPYR